MTPRSVLFPSKTVSKLQHASNHVESLFKDVTHSGFGVGLRESVLLTSSKVKLMWLIHRLHFENHWTSWSLTASPDRPGVHDQSLGPGQAMMLPCQEGLPPPWAPACPLPSEQVGSGCWPSSMKPLSAAQPRQGLSSDVSCPLQSLPITKNIIRHLRAPSNVLGSA